jgi:hypothetical protein
MEGKRFKTKTNSVLIASRKAHRHPLTTERGVGGEKQQLLEEAAKS